MRITKVQSCVQQGLCTSDQVRETLSNAGLSESDIVGFMRGELELGRPPAAMLHQLIETGVVPIRERALAYSSDVSKDPPVDKREGVQVPELLYCLKVLRTMPSEAPRPTMDAMFGTYRRIALTDAWVQERFGECDAHFGPHHFFAYRALDNNVHVATVWARDDEANQDLLKSQLAVRFDLHGVISLRRQVELLRADQ